MSNLQPGQMLGPYRIINQIGKGGMATVYKAYHANMDRYVAVKVLALQFAQNEEFLGRFQQEARLIARLEHPHILPVYDSGESDHTPYLVMRYLEAGTLKDRLTTGGLSREEIDRLFTQLADALAYAHENGVIHRDMKPTNVMLDKRGDIFLTDFGIAKLVEGSPQFTATGAITGTPDYMSPEQAQGGKIDQRTDIYALGIILYEMLTGRVPFEADTPLAVILKKIQEPLPPPTTINRSIPAELEAVVLKALAREPEDRFQTTREFLNAWKRAMAIVTTIYKPVQFTQITSDLQAPVSARLSSTPSLTPSLQAPTSTSKRKPILLIAGLSCAGLAALAATIVIVLLIAMNLRGKGADKKLASSIKENTPAKQATATIDVIVETEYTPTFVIPPARPPTEHPARVVALPPSAQDTESWKSWAAANTISALAVNGDEIVAGSSGSLTIWNRKDGSYRQITSRDGLPGARVMAVYADVDGTWWFGTDAGLAHFDGSAWNYFNTENGLDSSEVSAITRVGNELWVGTQYSGVDRGGLLRFNGQRWEPITGFPSTEYESTDTVSYNVTKLLQDNNGWTWVATTDGLAMYDGLTWHVFDTPQGLPSPVVTTLTLDNQGTVWIGTFQGGVLRFDGNVKEFMPVNISDIGDIQGIVQDSKGNYWISGYKLARYLPAKNELKYFNPGEELPVADLSVAARDDQGTLYFGTYGSGLLRYDGKFTMWSVPGVPQSGSFRKILTNPGGNIWLLQSNSTEVEQLDPATSEWSKVALNEQCCPVPEVWDAQGNLWAGGEQGLWVLDTNRNVVVHLTTEQGLPSDQVTAIAINPDGTAWVGTQAGLVAVKEGKITNVYDNSDSQVASNYVTALLIASDGSLWIGVEGGLAMSAPDGTLTAFKKGDVFSENLYWISDIIQDTRGAIWVSTLSDGIYRFAEGKWQHFSPDNLGDLLPVNGITSSAISPDGSLWFGLEGGGAIQLHPDGSTWTHYSLQDGLINMFVTDISVTSDGMVWFATAGGISRYKPQEAVQAPVGSPTALETGSTPGPAALSDGWACFTSFEHGMTCLDQNGWRAITAENGSLSHNMLTDLAICPDNTLVVGNIMGLNAFDGYTWKEIEPGWGYGTPDAIACDANNGLWLAYFDGVSHFDGNTWSNYSAQLLATGESANQLLKDIAVAPDGKVWAATANSVASFDGSQWTVYQQGQGFTEKLYFEKLVIDPQGNVWVSHSMGIEKFDGKQWSHLSDPGISVVRNLAIDAVGRLWVGTYSDGIYIQEGNTWMQYTRENSGLSSNSIYSIVFDAAGRAWITTEYGLDILNGDAWTVYRMDNADLVDNELRAELVFGNGPQLPSPLVKSTGALTAKLVDANGQTLRNTPVEICVESIGLFYSGDTPCSEQPFNKQAITDDNGVFTIVDLPEGYYVIAAKIGEEWVTITDSMGISSLRALVKAEQQIDLGQVTIAAK